MEDFQFTLLEEVEAEIAALTSALRHIAEDAGAVHFEELLVYPEVQPKLNNLFKVHDELLKRYFLEWEEYGRPF